MSSHVQQQQSAPLSGYSLSLDLELTAHEGLLSVELTVGHLHEDVVGGIDGDVGLSLGLALVGGALPERV